MPTETERILAILAAQQVQLDLLVRGFVNLDAIIKHLAAHFVASSELLSGALEDITSQLRDEK